MRRSWGGGREREKRLLARSPSGFRTAVSTRCRVQATSEGSSAVASDGMKQSTNTQHESEYGYFTSDPFDEFTTVSWPNERAQTKPFDDRDACQNWPPQGRDIGDTRIDADGVQSHEQRARDDGDAHLPQHVAHGACVRNQVASPRRAHSENHGSGNDYC